MMSRQEIMTHIELIFRDIFDDDELIIKEEMTSSDVDGWDSLTHITLIDMVEEEFSVKFTITEIADLKNVGQLVSLVEKYID